MEKSELKEIYRIAKSIRKEIELGLGTYELEGMCHCCSKELKKALKSKGIKSKIVLGQFKVDNTFTEYMDDEEINNEAVYYPPHYWVEIGNYIIDITADQFNNELDVLDYVNDVVIGTYKELPRYIKNNFWKFWKFWK